MSSILEIMHTLIKIQAAPILFQVVIQTSTPTFLIDIQATLTRVSSFGYPLSKSETGQIGSQLLDRN